MPKVSVAMCSYNHEKYVAQAIKSVLNQSFADFELVIVDDGSSDKTVQEIEKFSDSRIRFFRFSHNRGAGLAAQRCLEELRGEYIAVLNSDDIFLPGKLEQQVSFLEKHPEVGAVFSRAEIIGENGLSLQEKDHFYYQVFNQENRSRQEWLRHFFYKANCLCHPSVMIRRTVQNEIGAYDPRLMQLADLDFWMRLCKKYEIFILPEKLSAFRVREGEANTSGARPVARYRTSMETLQVLRHYLDFETIEEFMAVFPGCPPTLRPSEPTLIPLSLARLILETGEPAFCEYRLFALQILYQQLAQPERAQYIQKQTGVDYAYLLKMAGKYDVFGSLPGWVTRLYWEDGSGFHSEKYLVLQANHQLERFDFSFVLPAEKGSGQFRWDPLEGAYCQVEALEVSWQDEAGNEHFLSQEELKHNGVGGSLREQCFFETLDPNVYFMLPPQARSLCIRGKWKIWDTQDMITYQEIKKKEIFELQRKNENLGMLMAELHGTLTLCQERYAQVEALRLAMENSLSWRMTATLRWWGRKMRCLRSWWKERGLSK